MRLTAALAIGVAFLATSSAGAQVIQAPPRSSGGLFGGDRPPDPERVQHNLLLSVSTLGGYDDNLTPGGDAAGGGFATTEPGYTGFADAALNYRRTHRTQLFEVGGRWYVNTFRNLGVTPTYGGNANSRLTAPIGRRNELRLGITGRTDSVYGVGSFAPLGLDVERAGRPDANVSNGFLERRSSAADSGAGFTTRWSRRNALGADYSYSLVRYEDGLGDGQNQAAAINYTRTVGRRSSIVASVRHSIAEYEQLAGGVSSIADDTASLGFTHEHRVSATRRWLLAVGAGADRLDSRSAVSGSLRRVLPSAYANLRVDVARTWTVTADYRRSVSVLEGVVTEPLVADAGLLQLGGQLHDRLQAVASAGYSIGHTPGGVGNYDSYVAIAQLRFRLMQGWSFVLSDTVSAYQLQDLGALPVGFPTDLHRNAIRVGLYLNLPLYGRFAEDLTPR